MSSMAIRDAFGEALVEVGKLHPNVVVVSCDLKGATKTKKFFDVFPERSFEVGIAEANGLGICAGLALSGLRPFISSFGSFITGKNVEIRTSIAYNKAPVVIVGTHGGLIGPDGTTQAGLQDVTTMRVMPHFIVLQPASPIETKAIIHYVAQSQDLVYLRVARNKVPEIYTSDYKFVLGKGHIIHEGKDLVIFASGPVVHNALEAARLLKDQISIRVVNLPSLKPVDRQLIIDSAKKTQAVFTLEDHSIEGGLGSIVCEVIAEAGLATPVYRHGIRDVFSESGTPEELEEKFELNTPGTIKHIQNFFTKLKHQEKVNVY
jgi:transketolase